MHAHYVKRWAFIFQIINIIFSEMTLDLRDLGVPWTLHCWMHTLATAHEHRLESIIDQLLQDFLQVWPDDYSAQFVDECLPLLFTIFRCSKVSLKLDTKNYINSITLGQ